MVQNLSPKQLETVEVIYKLTLIYDYPPTLDEIANEMKIKKGSLQYHIEALKKKQAISWSKGMARSLKITDQKSLKHCKEKFKDLITADTLSYRNKSETAIE